MTNESRLIPILVLVTVITTFIIIPLKVTGYGYLPPDDALRHAGKAVSEKSWQEILVLRDDVKMDSHPGWHTILGLAHRTLRWNADSLVVFSVIVLFIFFCMVPVFFLTRSEAWLMSLFSLVVLQANLITRLFLGRPYIFTMACLLFVCFLWPRFRDEKMPRVPFVIITFLFAASTWIHCSWHLLFLILISFLLAREWRVAYRIGLSIVIGIAIGALLTTHPLAFLKQTLYHPIRAFSTHGLQRMLVGEFQPFAGSGIVVIFVLMVTFWHMLKKTWNKKIIDNPVFILASMGWILGFVSRRFWLDWGAVALLAWLSLQFQTIMEERLRSESFARFFLTVVVAGALYLSLTADIGSRWTGNLTKEYLSQDNPEHRAWLPEAGGIAYSDTMTVFYDTFFANPRATWRYVLGFEPAMMTPDDLSIYRKIQWNYGDDKSFKPWVEKMRTGDRLILRRDKGSRPNIPELEWYYVATRLWSGRLRQERKTGP